MGVYAHGKNVVEMPFLDFAPDLAYNAPVSGKGITLIDMDNAQPTTKGYQALNSPQALAGPALETVLGSTLAYFSNGAIQVFTGGPTHLYRWDGPHYTPVSGALVANDRWRFTQFGDDLIAINPGAPVGTNPAPVIHPQVYNHPGTSGGFVPLSSVPSAVGAPPDNPTCLCAVNGQVLMFKGNTWYCSGLGTDIIWTPDIQTQAGTGIFYDYPGTVVACAPIFRNCVVFKQTCTYLMNYVGGYPVWSNQLISDETGTWCQESVVVLPDSVAFLGSDDFYTCSGYTPQRIPNNFKEWFWDVADPTKFNLMQSRYDVTHGIAYWYFVTKSPPFPDVCDRWVAWNPRTGRWATGYLAQGAFSVPYPNQQPGWLSGLFFNQAQVLNGWSASPSTMRLSTGYFGSSNGFSQVMRVRPIYYVAPDSATVLPYHVTNLGDPDVNGPMTFLNQKDGWYYLRQTDRWHRFQIQTDGPDDIPGAGAQTGAEISALALDIRDSGWR